MPRILKNISHGDRAFHAVTGLVITMGILTFLNPALSEFTMGIILGFLFSQVLAYVLSYFRR